MISDGDVFNAATVNTRLSAVVSSINSVPMGALAFGALRREHLPPLVDGVRFPNGLTQGDANNAAYDTYNNALSGDFTPGVTVDFQLYSADAPSAPYGPCVGTGWRIPATGNSSAEAAEVVFVGGGFSLTDAALHGLLVFGCVEIGESQPDPGLTSPFHDCVQIGIGFRDASGARHVIEDSIVSYSKPATGRGPVSAWWYIRQEDLDEYGDGTVESVCVVIATKIIIENDNSAADVDVGSYWVSVLPIHGGDLD